MRPRFWLSACLVVLGASPVVLAQEKPPELVASTDPRTPEAEREAFHLPPGFAIQLVAAEPEIHKPMNLAFDDRGRLWVTETLEYPFPASGDVKARDGVKILSDFDEDGRARSITPFADGLNIPIGLLPMPGGRSALVHSIPRILRLEDTDGDGRADRRGPAYALFEFRDTHGMTNSFTWGFDGWIYATHGFSNDSTVQGSDGQAIRMQSGNTYRMRPDGSRLEYFTHGQVNPFGLAFDPLGNLYSADCHSKPVYQLLRGAWYPSFGKPHDGLGFGPEMVQHDHGSTAIAGIVYYAADQFPADYRDAVYIGNVVTNRINFDKLQRHGSTYLGIAQPDFLRSDDPWFRPVDIKLGPDGALYVADFYNRIIGHYEVPLDHPGRDRERGRIWRIVYQGDGAAPGPPRLDPAETPVAEWIARLDHPNLTVRTFATNRLAVLGESAKAALVEFVDRPTSPTARAHALWALFRIDPDRAIGPVLAATRAEEVIVRVHAQRILAERAEWTDDVRAASRSALADADAFVVRAAAEGLGRHPRGDQVGPLLAVRLAVPAEDTHLLHSARMALRDQFLAESTWGEFPAADLPEPEARALADVMTGVPTARAATFLMAHVRKYAEARETLISYVHHIARYGDPTATSGAIAFAGEDWRKDPGRSLAMAKAIVEGTRERGEDPAESLRDLAAEIGKVGLASDDGGLLAPLLELTRALNLGKLQPEVVQLAGRRRLADGLRVSAFETWAELDPAGAIRSIGAVLADPSESDGIRDQAASLLARLNRPECLDALKAVLPTATARVQGVVAAVLVSTPEGTKALLDSVASGKASAQLLTDRAVEVRLRQADRKAFAERVAELTRGLAPAEQQVRERIQGRVLTYRKASQEGRIDLGRGAQLFEKHCSACHTLAGKGGKVGPQLDGVGARGADRLVEDMLDPNRNVDQEFRATTLALADGQVISGLLLREEGEVLVMADAKGAESRIDRARVEERRVDPISPMPANLGDQIGDAEFSELLAFLLAQVPAGTGGDAPRP